MDAGEARERFAAAPVARLATVDAAARPHLVAVTFAVAGDLIYTAVDRKPKRTVHLRRLANVRANPAVALLVDHYEDDWTRLWWSRADGEARVVEPGDPVHARAVGLLGERYERYRSEPPDGPAIEVAVQRWSGWSAD